MKPVLAQYETTSQSGEVLGTSTTNNTNGGISSAWIIAFVLLLLVVLGIFLFRSRKKSEK